MSDEIDTTLVGQVAAGLMDQVSEQFGDEGSVQTVAIVVEVQHPEDEDGDSTTITCACSDRRAWAQAGLLDFAARLVERQALR